MAHDLDTRRAVRASYVFDQLSLEVAALKHTIPMGTARNWKRAAKEQGDDWDKSRAANFLSKGNENVLQSLLEKAIRQLEATTDIVDDKPDMPPEDRLKMLASAADSITKIVAVNRRLSPETDKLGVGMDVLQKFAEFTGKKYPKHAEALLEVLEPFGVELARLYG